VRETTSRTAGPIPHVLAAVAETPWAIRPEKLQAIIELVAARAAGVRWTDEEISARLGAGRQRPAAAAADGPVALLPLRGVLFPRTNMLTEMSGATSLESWRQQLRGLVEDRSVEAIVLDIDSPGGSTDFVAETAADLRAARAVKPLIAVANPDAGSAAYWLASQAAEVVITPSGAAGSIGVLAAHEDISRREELLGVKTTLISAGTFKTELSPFSPLTEEALQAVQARVDDMYGMFVRDVARGRGVGVDTVRQGFGEGRMLGAKRALEEGLVDRVDTLDAVVAGLRKPGRAAHQPAANAAGHQTVTPQSTFVDEAAALHDSLAGLVGRARTLAELRAEGRLTAAKREQLAAVLAALDSLDERRGEIRELLSSTDPNRHADAALAERARFERRRHNP